VLPALAIAEALVERGHPVESVHYMGARRGLETRLVPPTGHPMTLLAVTGLQRRLTPRNVLMPLRLGIAVVRAWRVLGRLRPKVIVSVGGYASLPAVLAAKLRGVPVVVVSYDQRPGQASKLTAKFAAACAVAFEGTGLPNARSTGAPLRRSVLRLDGGRDRLSARDVLDLPGDRFVVTVTGGSQGSGALNAAVAGFVEQHADRRDLAVRHVVGERFLAQASPTRDGADGILYQVIGYEDRLPLVYAASDLVVGRAGAGTVCEVAAIGVPSILVPWPGAAENHQEDNARTLSDIGAAVMLLERDLSPESLGAAIERLAADRVGRDAMAAAARAAGERHRSPALVDLIEEVANG
jgi:UDP-N-acetylglucosamine--N-acetylmuramyl-(pentapeptide) pyrophosphoryl-undecaprenol N-acetylglucosamine transferase